MYYTTGNFSPLKVFYLAFLLGTSLHLFVLALFEYQFLFKVVSFLFVSELQAQRYRHL